MRPHSCRVSSCLQLYEALGLDLDVEYNGTVRANPATNASLWQYYVLNAGWDRDLNYYIQLTASAPEICMYISDNSTMRPDPYDENSYVGACVLGSRTLASACLLAAVRSATR